MGVAAFLILALEAVQPVEAPSATQAAPPPEARPAESRFRYHGALVRVPDLDRALEFYVGVLGFQAERLTPVLVRLQDDTPIYLERVDYPLRPPGDDEARSAIAFQTRDIGAAVERLRRLGVVFLADEPAPVGVGLSIRFRDPFGNIHALLEHRITDVPPFEEPEVYNSGYKHPDADTDDLRALFVGAMGFDVRTERYYPPSLPIGHRDGSFAFMLHENEPWEAEIRPREDPRTAAVSLVFVTDDLAEARRVLLGAIGPGGIGPERRFGIGRRFDIIVPSGVPAELWRFAPGP